MKIIDARGLQPPEPFERVIDALVELPLGEELKLVIPVEPLPLYRFLRNNRYTFKTAQIAEGHYEVVIRELAGGAPPGKDPGNT